MSFFSSGAHHLQAYFWAANSICSRLLPVICLVVFLSLSGSQAGPVETGATTVTSHMPSHLPHSGEALARVGNYDRLSRPFGLLHFGLMLQRFPVEADRVIRGIGYTYVYQSDSTRLA